MLGNATPRYLTDWLLPFLRLPDLRFCLGFTYGDGANFYSEDLGARAWTLTGSLPKYSTALGVPYVAFSGAQYLSVADAEWNSIAGAHTVLCVAKSAVPSTANYFFGRAGLYLRTNSATATTLEYVVNDGSTSKTTAVANGLGTSFSLLAGRVNPAAQQKVWGNNTSAVSSSAIPTGAQDNAAAWYIGALAGIANLNADVALIALCGALLDDGHITQLINHCKRWGMNP